MAVTNPTDAAPVSPGWLVKALGIVGMVFGASLALPGLYLTILGGSWYYAIAGALTMLAGWRIFRGRGSGVYIFIGVCLATLVWALWEVRDLDTWFWPLIPRLFAFAFALFFVLLIAPGLPDFASRPAARRGFRIGALGVFLGLALAVWQMFSPHGVIANGYTGRAATLAAAPAASGEWRNYGRTTNGTRFAPAAQINRDNVGKLALAWTYDTGQVGDHDNADQSTPVFANGTIYACTFNNQVHAIDAVSGKRKWVFDPRASAPFFKRCRGVTYYETGAPNAGDSTAPIAACARRIALGTVDARLISLDAETGAPCTGFGTGGTVDLNAGMSAHEPGEYMQTSAPTVSSGVIVVGGLVLDNGRVGEPSGVVRAFDAASGELRWAWDVGRPGQTGAPGEGESYTPFTPNMWTHPAVDEARGLVFLPLGNATPDMWRGHRRAFDDTYNAAVVALDIRTGAEKWHFQTVHKDVWDYDLPAQPSLFDIADPQSGQLVPVLVQPTKRGQIFVLNRETGQPVTRVVERKVQTDGAAPGLSDLSPTQPYSVGMPQIGGAAMSERDMWGATPIDQLLCRISFNKLRYSGDEFTPPSEEPFFTYPGAQGGMNWGSGSIDESRGIFVINDLRLPIVTRLIPRKDVPRFDRLQGPHDPIGPQFGTPYALERTAQASPLGLLCSRPPYGTLTAIDLNTRKIVWQKPVGTLESLDFIGVQTGLRMPVGMPTLGGSLVTGGGLVFFGSAMDHYLRAFDVENGRELAALPMPVGANATPMSFTGADGRQYVVISAGGATYAAEGFRSGKIIAFALPGAGNPAH